MNSGLVSSVGHLVSSKKITRGLRLRGNCTQLRWRQHARTNGVDDEGRKFDATGKLLKFVMRCRDPLTNAVQDAASTEFVVL